MISEIALQSQFYLCCSGNMMPPNFCEGSFFEELEHKFGDFKERDSFLTLP